MTTIETLTPAEQITPEEFAQALGSVAGAESVELFTSATESRRPTTFDSAV